MIRLKKTLCLIITAFIFAFPILSADYNDMENQSEESIKIPSGSIPSRVIITDYSVEGGGLEAGKVCTVTFIIENTSKVSNVTSVLMTGWIDSVAPVEFAETNQVYVDTIVPGEKVSVVFKYYVKKVDMKAIGNVSAGFTIYYNDEALAMHERTNSISVKLPVLHGEKTTIDEEYMQWSTPLVSNRERLLSSNIMQALYAAGFVFSCIWIVLLILFKFGVLKRGF